MQEPDIPANDDRAEPGDFSMRQRGPEQPSLFPKEELIVPETVLNLRKSVSIIQAVPTKADHNQGVNGKRLIDACITAAQIDFRARGKVELERVFKERISPMFEIRVGELSRIANIPGRNYGRIYEELDNLFEMTFLWNVIGEDSSVEWKMKTHFLSSLGYGQGDKRGLIRFSLDPSVLQMVLDPKLWATLSFKAMEEGLGTAASYALYQNTWRYVGTHAKVTAALPTETWIELLIGKSRYVVEEKGVKRTENYGDFKRRVLMDAIRRVNEVNALSYTLELKETRSNRRIVKLQFKFIPKKQTGLGLPMTWGGDLISFLADIGFTEAEIKDLGESHSLEEVAESVIRLKTAETKIRAQGGKLTSRKSYFNGILSNVASGASSGDEMNHAQIEAEAKKQDAQKAAGERQKRAQEEFEGHKARRFKEGFFELPEDQRMALGEEFMGSEQAAGAAALLKRGLTPSNAGALSFLRTWLAKNHPEAMEQILAMPEDQSLEAWLAWRLDSAK